MAGCHSSGRIILTTGMCRLRNARIDRCPGVIGDDHGQGYAERA
jgi:hypothetical protein